MSCPRQLDRNSPLFTAARLDCTGRRTVRTVAGNRPAAPRRFSSRRLLSCSDRPPPGRYVDVDNGLQVCMDRVDRRFRGAVERCWRERMRSKSTSKVHSSPGCHGGALPSSTPVVLARTAAAAAAAPATAAVDTTTNCFLML